MRVAPDDEVYRVNTVWLGPRGLTFPWTARYLAYAVWLLTFMIIIGIEAVTPLNVGLPAVWQTFVADLSAPRRETAESAVISTRKVRIRRQGRPVSPVPGTGRRVRAARKVG